MRFCSTICLLLFLIMLSGCAVQGAKMSGVLTATERGDYPAAIKHVKKTIKERGKDQLLYFLELGLLKHLNGDYQASNSDLHRAERIAEELETTSARDLIKTALTSPAQGRYGGTDFERVFIHYYKVLNYLLLALDDPTQAESSLEAARIESRKVDIILTALQKQEGTYQESRDNKKKLFSQLTEIFSTLRGSALDKDLLVYRENAYIRYLTGLVYESNGEYDEARVSYQQAAELYENGYAKQYSLENDITEQAWFDTIRMMKRAGGYKSRWPRLARQKLSKFKRDQLADFKRDSAQLIVIEHAGMVPHREELSLQLTLDAYRKELVLRPLFSGTVQERADQHAWFYAMYAGKGLLDIAVNYDRRGFWGALDSFHSKRFYLSPVWKLAKNIGLPQAFSGLPARVTVPYYRPHPAKFSHTELWINGRMSATLIEAESIAQLALQEQLKNTTNDLQKAVSREVLKKVMVYQMAEKVKKEDESLGRIFKVIGDISNMATSQADTRNWLTLPHSIRVSRVPLQSGRHEIKIVTRGAANSAVYQQSVRHINIEKGEIYVLRQRTTEFSSGALVKKGHHSHQEMVIENIVLEGVSFKSGSTQLTSNSKSVLMRVAANLRGNSSSNIKVAGYTDSVGSPESNRRLSQKRAEIVMSFLVAEGVDEKRLTAKGYGANDPIMDNSTPQGRAKNRRVELHVSH